MSCVNKTVSLDPASQDAGQPAMENRKQPFPKIVHAAELLAKRGPAQIFSLTGSWLPLIRRLPALPKGSMVKDEASHKRISLSIDDGPTPFTTRSIVRLLARYNAKATFFLTGERLIARPDLAEVLVQAGHDVFAHGWKHIRYEQPDQLMADLDKVETLLRRFRPTPAPYLVRLPYAAGRRSEWVHRTIRRWNASAQIAHWTYWMEDWEIPLLCRNRGDLEKLCKKKVDKLLERPRLNGAIILLHDRPYDVNVPMTPFVAPVLLKQVLDRLTHLGFTFVPIIPWPKQPSTSRFFLY
jgi:peptidoglycan-N-acetylglucosamine deacetylase